MAKQKPRTAPRVKRGPKSADDLFRELAAVSRPGASITGPVVRRTFNDGTSFVVPLDLHERILASQRLRLKGMEGGKLGGRPEKATVGARQARRRRKKARSTK